jgi:hypothetical protein
MPSETLERAWRNYVANANFQRMANQAFGSEATPYRSIRPSNDYGGMPIHGLSRDSVKNGDILISTTFPNAMRVAITANKKEYYFKSSTFNALEKENLIKVLI